MGVVGIDIISKRGERRKYLPLETRMKMYEDVLKLGRQGLKYKEIQKIIYKKHRKRLPIPTAFHWINEKHNPLGKVNKFDEKPSPELEYIVGTMFSDGYKYIGKKSRYSLRLDVNDREFAEKFAECLTKVLGKKKPYKPFWSKSKKQWIIEGCSVQLYKFLDRPLEELKPYIEHCKDCVASFLRALYDAEGSICVKIKGRKRKRRLYLYNTNKELLVYVQYLLKKYFGINSTLHLAIKKGSISHFPNNKIAKTNQDEYYVYIHARSLLNFYRCIGFTIKRKQRDLIRAIQ